MSLKYNNVCAPGEVHMHGNVKCYSKSCTSHSINDPDRIVRDKNLVEAPVPTDWRSLTDPINNAETEACLGQDLKTFRKKEI